MYKKKIVSILSVLIVIGICISCSNKNDSQNDIKNTKNKNQHICQDHIITYLDENGDPIKGRNKYVLEGFRWYQYDLTYSYVSNGSLDPLNDAELVRKAFDVWESVIPIKFTETTSSDAHIRISWVPSVPLSVHPIAVAKTNLNAFNLPTYATIEIGNDTEFNDDLFVHTMLHEIGHVLGLDHDTDNANAVMWKSVTTNTARTSLHENDLDGIHTLYRDINTSMFSEIDNNAKVIDVKIADETGYIYQLHSNGEIWMWDQATSSWGGQPIDNNIRTKEIAATKDMIYQRHDNGEIWEYKVTVQNANWVRISDNPATIAIRASNGHLYELHGTGWIYKYNGNPFDWSDYDNNSATKEIEADGNMLYQRHDSGAVFASDVTIGGWSHIYHGNSVSKMSAKGNKLYILRENGEIHKWNGSSNWDPMGSNIATKDIQASGDFIYQRHKNGRVFVRDSNSNGWSDLNASGTDGFSSNGSKTLIYGTYGYIGSRNN